MIGTSFTNAIALLPQTAAVAGPRPLSLVHAGDDPNLTGGFWEEIFFRGGATTSTPQATDGLFMLIFWFGVFWFVLLSILWIWWAWKYRRRPGVAAEPSPSHSTMLEIVWTVVPSSALIVLFLLGFWTYMEKQVAPAGAIELRVSGWKWGWEITYPDGEKSPWQLPLDPGHAINDGAGVPVFVVPEDTDIALRMSSQDVLHSFWIPDFRVKMDLFPNRYSGYTFRTPLLNAGQDYQDHWIFCAEYCGDFHAEMGAILRVVPRTEYGTILASWDTGNLTPEQLGQGIAARQCYICHSIDGSAGSGPTWKNLYGYEQPMADGSTVLGDEDYIRESILVPTAKVHAGYPANMPVFNFSETELEGLIAYIRTLSDRYTPPEDGAGEASGDAATDDADGTAGEEDPAEETPADETPDQGEAEAALPVEGTPEIEITSAG